MLESMNDYLSLIVLLFLVLLALRLLIASCLNFKETANLRQLWKAIVLFNENEDE